jgi:hypothetical protein
MSKSEKWYCLRHPKTHREVRTDSWKRMILWKARGYELMAVLEPYKVNKNVSA